MTVYAADSVERSPFRVRFPLFLVIGAAAELICIALDVDLVATVQGIIQTVLISSFMFFLMALVVSLCSNSGMQRFGYVVSLLILAIAWLSLFVLQSGVPALMVLAVAGITTLFRYQRLHIGKAIAGVHLQFHIDTAILVLVCTYFGLGLLIGALPLGPALSGFFEVLALLTAWGWMYVLWAFERSVTGTQGARRAGLVVFLGIALVCGLFGLKALYYGLLVAFFGGALIFTPLFGHLPKFHAYLYVLNGYGHHSKSPSAKEFHAPPPLISPHFIHVLAVIVCIIVLCVAVWLIFSRKRQHVSADSSDNALQVIERKSLSDVALRFEPTENPIRLQVQAWLRNRIAAGLALRTSETIRQSMHNDGQTADPNRDLLFDYERTRYGK